MVNGVYSTRAKKNVHAVLHATKKYGVYSVHAGFKFYTLFLHKIFLSIYIEKRFVFSILYWDCNYTTVVQWEKGWSCRYRTYAHITVSNDYVYKHKWSVQHPNRKNIHSVVLRKNTKSTVYTLFLNFTLCIYMEVFSHMVVGKSLFYSLNLYDIYVMPSRLNKSFDFSSSLWVMKKQENVETRSSHEFLLL